MYILVALGAVIAAWGQCEAPLGSYLKRQLTQPRLEQLVHHEVTLVGKDGPVARGVVIAAGRWARDRRVFLRLLNRDTNVVEELEYAADAAKLKRVLVFGVCPEIEEARRRAGPDAETAYIQPREHAARAIDGWLDVRRRVYLVVAREDTPGLEVLEGLLTLPTPAERRASWGGDATHLSLATDTEVRRIEQRRLVAAFGAWAGF